jgi:hypothetical protein
MLADFAAEIAADHVMAIGTDGAIDEYMIAWREIDMYLIDNPRASGLGRGQSDRLLR